MNWNPAEWLGPEDCHHWHEDQLEPCHQWCTIGVDTGALQFTWMIGQSAPTASLRMMWQWEEWLAEEMAVLPLRGTAIDWGNRQKGALWSLTKGTTVCCTLGRIRTHSPVPLQTHQLESNSAKKDQRRSGQGVLVHTNLTINQKHSLLIKKATTVLGSALGSVVSGSWSLPSTQH